MLQPVENLMQPNNSTLQQTSTPRDGEITIPFIPEDYSFEEFTKMMQVLQPRYFRISTRKDKINIIFAITKKKAYFGRSESFSEAFRKLVKDIKEIPQA